MLCFLWFLSSSRSCFTTIVSLDRDHVLPESVTKRDTIIQKMSALLRNEGYFWSTKSAQFLSTMILADMEELIEGQPFGEIVGLKLWNGSVIGKALFAGITEEIGVVNLTVNMVDDVDRFLDVIIEIINSMQDLHLQCCGYERHKCGTVVSKRNLRPFN